MNWLEIIELRSAGNNRQLLASELQNLIHELDKAARREAIKAYSRMRVDSDFSIHLFHDSKEMETNGSRLGLRIAAALKAFGLVKHRIWIELEGD
jgi:hypothetical protein